ncbi:MAG: hypothetical protein IJ480_03645 [Clostridia bacterium]|nr:hypothetical protein [Clostridia bacterium]
MGVSTADIFAAAALLPTMLSPATDDPIVAIAVVMGISGVLMLVCGGLGIAARIRHSREEAGKHTRK